MPFTCYVAAFLPCASFESLWTQTKTECITSTVKENFGYDVVNSVTFMALHEMHEVRPLHNANYVQVRNASGVGGESASPKALIWWKSGQNRENFRKIHENTGKNGVQRLQNHMKTFYWRSSEKRLLGKTIRTKSGPKFFRASLGKFGQKFFAPPNICLLLHICATHTIMRFNFVGYFNDMTYYGLSIPQLQHLWQPLFLFRLFYVMMT